MMAETVEFSFTEYEEGICFDQDDPDFSNHNSCINNINSQMISSFVQVSSPMSLASMYPSSGLTNRSHSINSLDDVHNSYFNAASETVLSIEELRLQLNSCFTCGVSWHEEHVSLDCAECGGYSLERPCPLCDGRCKSVWKRDLTMSHACGKARWEGSCSQRSSLKHEEESRLCNRLEKLTAKS